MFKNKRDLIIYISVTVILIICIGLVGFNVLNKHILNKEVSILLDKNIQTDDYSIKVKSKFQYGKVEKAIKEYMKDYSDDMKQVNEIINNDSVKNILSANNYKSDGPNFEKSIKLITEQTELFNSLINELLSMNEEETIIKYIDKYDVDDKYREFYKNLMFDSKNKESLEVNKNTILNIKDNGLKVLNIDLEILKMLRDNPNDWIVKDGKIYFYSNNIMNQYNELIKKVQ